MGSCFCTTTKKTCKSEMVDLWLFKAFDQHKFIIFSGCCCFVVTPHKTVQRPFGKIYTLSSDIPNSDGCACMRASRLSSTNVKYVADSLQKLPHPPPASVSSHCSCLRENAERQKVAGSGGWGREGGSGTLGTHAGLCSMSPFMPHSFTLSPH